MTRPVQNTPVITRRTLTQGDSSQCWCRHCGAFQTGAVNFSESTWGTARLDDLDQNLSNYETNDSSDFEIMGYRCTECDLESDCMSELFTDEEPDDSEEEEES